MRIAVLSGKGGTGKTLVSTNLAYVIGNCTYIDCDVEEPNGAIFLKPKVDLKEKVYVTVPSVVEDICTGCRQCVEFCKFNALAYIKDRVVVFPELCHDCGGCIRLCSSNALTEEKREIGYIEIGRRDGIVTRTGTLNIGESTGVPVIKRLLEGVSDDKDTIIDCPPGSSCAVMESIEDSDFCLLVTEPTVFGVHNLRMVYELVQLLSIPYGVVINKAEGTYNIAEDFCRRNGIPVLGTIPFDRDIALLSSQGRLVSEKEKFFKVFSEIHEKVKEASAK